WPVAETLGRDGKPRVDCVGLGCFLSISQLRHFQLTAHVGMLQGAALQKSSNCLLAGGFSL
ncbi:MAG: hypothetical protein ABIK86_06585, partial [candidate division WOR-3 bacterium]